MQITLKNTLTLDKITLNVDDISTNSLYYQFEIDFSDFSDGEYEYTLVDESGQIKSTGILRIGNYNNTSTTTYNKQSKYITYNGKK